MVYILFLFTSCKKETSFGEWDYKTLGTSARDLLSASPYTSLIVQISYMPGYAPGTASINNLAGFLNTYLNKPTGIQVLQQPIMASGKNSLTLKELVQVEKANRSVFTGGNTMTVHFLITDSYYNNTNTFATSYWSSSSALFGKAINDNSGAAGQVSRTHLMSTLLEHEFGHLLGLVDQGSPMQSIHRDIANGAHCENAGCLMYYGIETNASVTTVIPLPDGNCVADMKANGGK